MKKMWNWIKVALAIVFSVFAYVFFTRRNNFELKKKIDEVKTEAKKQEAVVKEVKKRIENRKKKAGKLADRLKKHFNIFIVLCIVFSVGVIGVTSPTVENLKIPDNYSDLLVAYKDMADIAIGYQKLYNEAEQDNQALLEVIENLQSLMKVQQDIINELLKKNRFGLFAGVNYVPLNPSYSGLIAGLTFEF
ncbi:MAG: hypothetical protein E3J83_03235 [Candidatus Atribacteria bacterium]|nr:MAG: hypothetical protein E3J83_03235 [Candidatus Atribacteria bacterium]